MIIIKQQELFLWPPELAWHSIMIILYYPVKITLEIFHNLAYKFSSFRMVINRNKPITIIAVWDLAVWGFVALLAIVLPLIILRDTVNEVKRLGQSDKKPWLIWDLSWICGKLISYYILTAIFLYVIFNYFVSEKILSQYLNR